MGSMVITGIDRAAGTIDFAEEAFLEAKRAQFDAMYRRLAEDVSSYLFRTGDLTNFEVGQSIALNPIELGLDRTAEPIRLAGCTIGQGAISATVVAVVGSLAALEWLRQRKQAVAAAEGSEEAYRSLLSDFIVWLTSLFAKMRAANAP
jgi:hypothetical protein